MHLPLTLFCFQLFKTQSTFLSLRFHCLERKITEWLPAGVTVVKYNQGMKNIPLLLMGCGGVGRQLLLQIVSLRSIHAKQGIHLRIVGICDSKHLLVASDVFTTELDDTVLMEVCHAKSSGSSLLTLSNFGECQVFSNPETIRKMIEIAALLGKSTGLIFVDCSASSETTLVLNRVLDMGCCAVLANKKPLTSSMDDYDKFVAQARQVRFEATVCAGLPVIVIFNRMLSSGDHVHLIMGNLNGTLGYVMNEIADGKPFSQAVKVAKELGYTEPDPREDLSGMDVARKALILSRILGRRINLDGIKTESLYPEEMGPNAMPMEDFLMNGLPLLDKNIQERVQKASLNGKVLRYVCVIEESRCEVGIRELPKESPLGRLKGVDAMLEIYGRSYNEQPLVIQGARATTDGILADILDMQDLFP